MIGLIHIIIGIASLKGIISVFRYIDKKKQPEKLKPLIQDEEQAIKDFIWHFVNDNLSHTKEEQEQTQSQPIRDIVYAYMGTKMLMSDLIVGLVLMHAKALHNKRLQGSYLDDYGLLVDSGWEREQEYFVDNIILKNEGLAKMSLVLYQTLLHIRDALYALLEKELFEQLENKCKKFGQKLLTYNGLDFFDTDYSVGPLLKRFYLTGPHLELSRVGVIEHLNLCAGEELLSESEEFWEVYERAGSMKLEFFRCDRISLKMLGLKRLVLYDIINGDRFANAQIAIKKNVLQESLIRIDFSFITTVVAYAILENNVDLLEDFESGERNEILHIAQGSQQDCYDCCKNLINDVLDSMDNIAKKNTLKRVKGIKPLEYEKEIATKLKKLGFNARATKGSGDQGADVLADKNGVSFAIQCKMYSKPVGNKAVQEANTARDFYKCDYAAVITNADYTKSARQAANACNVILLNESEISKLNEYTASKNA